MMLPVNEQQEDLLPVTTLITYMISNEQLVSRFRVPMESEPLSGLDSFGHIQHTH